MIRAAFAALVLAGPASAASHADCAALLDRLGLEAGNVTAPSGTCYFRDVGYGAGDAAWHADVLALWGDVDALPDALPSRLTGGVAGLARGPVPKAPYGMGRVFGPPANAPIAVTFDLAGGGGALRIDALSLRMGRAGHVNLSAYLTGMPQVLPAEPAAMAAIRLRSLEMSVVTRGMVETLLRLFAPLPGGEAVAAETLHDSIGIWLDAFVEAGGEAKIADGAQAFLEALPAPRGVLDLDLGGDGVALIQLVPLFAGQGLPPETASRIAREAELALSWEPDAP